MTSSSFTRAYVAHDLGGDLHRLAQRAAVVAAALYVAGLAVGVVVHWANDWLSGDRRPWPVTWGVAVAPRPRLREIYNRLAIKTEVTMGTPSPDLLLSTVCPTPSAINADWVVKFIDLNLLSVGELRTLARKRGLRIIKTQETGRHRELHLARKADIIAALQCTP